MEALAHYGTAKDSAIDYFGAAIFGVDSPTHRKRSRLTALLSRGERARILAQIRTAMGNGGNGKKSLP